MAPRPTELRDVDEWTRRRSRRRGTAAALLLGALLGACATSGATSPGANEGDEAALCRRGLHERTVGQALAWSGVGAVVAGFALMVASSASSAAPAKEDPALAIPGGIAMGVGAALGALGALYLWGGGTLVRSSCPQ